MVKNSYEGVLEDWKVKLVCRRARRMKFRGPDLEDAQQQVVLALLDFHFADDKSNGASERTAITAVVDRQLAMIRRGEARAERQREAAKDRCQQYYEMPEILLAVDVERVVQSLPQLDQQICRGLALGHTVNQLAQSLGTSWHTVRARVQVIRRRFERLGLAESLMFRAEAVRS